MCFWICLLNQQWGITSPLSKWWNAKQSMAEGKDVEKGAYRRCEKQNQKGIYCMIQQPAAGIPRNLEHSGSNRYPATLCAKIWNPLRCPLSDELIKKCGMICNIIQLFKKREILPFIAKWTQLEVIILSNINQILHIVPDKWEVKL